MQNPAGLFNPPICKQKWGIVTLVEGELIKEKSDIVKLVSILDQCFQCLPLGSSNTLPGNVYVIDNVCFELCT